MNLSYRSILIVSFAVLFVATACLGAPGDYKVLYTFGQDQPATSGYYPTGLIAAGSKLMGVTSVGGQQNFGTIFAVNRDGSNFQPLYQIDSLASPPSTLFLDGGYVYGANSTTDSMIFRAAVDGSGLTILQRFVNEGVASLSTSNAGTLYGVTPSGGSSQLGSIFSVNEDGSNFTTLHSFTGVDGSDPRWGSIISNNILYGTTVDSGGRNIGNGTIFSYNLKSGAFSQLMQFPQNEDLGTDPLLSVAVGNKLYGVALSGGANGAGAVFDFDTSDNSFHLLHSFQFTGPFFGVGKSLVTDGAALYGTIDNTGDYNEGAIYRINLDGSGYTIIHSFGGPGDASSPIGSLVLDGSTLYGVTNGGGPLPNGNMGYGIVYSLSVPEPAMSAIIFCAVAGLILARPKQRKVI